MAIAVTVKDTCSVREFAEKFLAFHDASTSGLDKASAGTSSELAFIIRK
jgi:hypothetical protein